MSDLADKVGDAIGAELIRQELAGEDLSEAESNRLLGEAAIKAMREEDETPEQRSERILLSVP